MFESCFRTLAFLFQVFCLFCCCRFLVCFCLFCFCLFVDVCVCFLFVCLFVCVCVCVCVVVVVFVVVVFGGLLLLFHESMAEHKQVHIVKFNQKTSNS